MNNKYISILGREKELALAELERIYGSRSVKGFGNAAILSVEPEIKRLGGSPKTAELIKIVKTTSPKVLSQVIEQLVHELLSGSKEKIRFGISSYSDKLGPKALKPLVINLTKGLRKEGVRIRAVPNRTAELNSAQVWHNRLDKKPNLELVVVNSGDEFAIGRTNGIQDIEAYTKRDRQKPVRDMVVGMLPPKLAKLMINLTDLDEGMTILDPFCGTGTVLMEGLISGYKVYGTDVAPPMIEAATTNTQWLVSENGIGKTRVRVEMMDARTADWTKPCDAVVSETYLGPALNKLPEPDHLKAIVYEVDELITDSLSNLAKQLKPGTPLCLALPAWHDKNSGKYTHLPLVDDLSSLGYNLVDLKSVGAKKLIYHRPGQTVARQILIMTRK